MVDRHAVGLARPRSGAREMVSVPSLLVAALAGAAAVTAPAPALAAAGGPATIFVDADAAPGGDGSSWKQAFGGPGGVQSALTAAAAGDSIWVAEGTYLPTLTANRGISFDLRVGIALYGGFEGDEAALEERSPADHPAILSGDLNGDDTSGPGPDNSRHVVVADSGAITATTRLDGFVVRGGNADGGADPAERGGGLLCINGADPVIAGVIFEDNRCTFGGGASYVRNSSPRFESCVFRHNQGGNFGGAFDIFSSGSLADVVFIGCRVYGNRAGRAGGVEAFGNVRVTMTNCLVAGNTTTGQGGGLFAANGADFFLENCTIAANSAGQGGGAFISGGTLAAENTIFWANGPSEINTTAGNVLRNCIIAGGWTGAGTGNIDADPRLMDPAAGLATIGAGSAAADAGNNTLVPLGVVVDLSGADRFGDDDCAADTGTPGGAGGSLLVDIGAAERISSDVDCDGSGVADECEIADGRLDDCDGNGIPDSCDIDAGAEDCNDNGIPDTCEVARQIVIDSGVLAPFGSGASQSLTLNFDGAAAADVVIRLEASTDLDAAFEIVAVSLNGTSLGNVFSSAGNCEDPASIVEIVLTAAEWNAIITPGVPAQLDLVPNGAVGVDECPNGSFVIATVDVIVAGDNDADLDGVPDDCTSSPCPADLDGSGAIDLGDLLAILSTWGACDGEPCAADLDRDGLVGINDLLAVLAAWGPCP